MANYLLVESRDPFEYGDVGYFCGVAKDLAAAGNDVTVFLIQNGVLMSRRGVQGNPLSSVLGDGSGRIDVCADEFSLKERGIGTGSLVSGVKTSNVDELVDLLVQDGIKAVWH
ncbi:MAG: sulfur reduction protein DsrE [Dehalococcoidia bacterium]